MVLPTGTTVPPLLYLAVLFPALATVAYALYRVRPPVTDRTVLALAPWMVAGATTYVTYQLEIIPDPIAPFGSSPTVYGSATVVAGTTWLVANHLTDTPDTFLGTIGTIAALPPITVAVYGADTLTPFIPAVSLLTAIILTACYQYLADTRFDTLARTGYAGALVVFGQTLDGLSTALGVAHLGFGEQTPLSRILIDATATLPAPLLGAGWLFLLVKLALGVGVVWFLAPTVDRNPREGYLLLALVTAVGLGPGTHNLLLFTVMTP